MWQWRWRRRRVEPTVWCPPERIPDGQTVPVPGWPLPGDREAQRRALREPTQILPTVPLLTRAGRWRGGEPGGHRAVGRSAHRVHAHHRRPMRELPAGRHLPAPPVGGR
jgi:hypothetical protein